MANEKIKRLRMFAGPNGSGKSTMFDDVKRQFNVGCYVNADVIEKQLHIDNTIRLTDFQIEANKTDFDQFLINSSLHQKARKAGFMLQLKLENNQLINLSNSSFSYEAALIAAFIREQLLKSNNTFSFETVMSHPSKVEILKNAQIAGFKTYLYFISTQFVSINIQRVANRVSKGGHPVPKDKIESRYYQSLDLLIEAIAHTDRTYIFDNSGEHYQLEVEIFQGYEATIHKEFVQKWVHEYVLERL